MISLFFQNHDWKKFTTAAGRLQSTGWLPSSFYSVTESAFELNWELSELTDCTYSVVCSQLTRDQNKQNNSKKEGKDEFTKYLLLQFDDFSSFSKYLCNFLIMQKNPSNDSNHSFGLNLIAWEPRGPCDDTNCTIFFICNVILWYSLFFSWFMEELPNRIIKQPTIDSEGETVH